MSFSQKLAQSYQGFDSKSWSSFLGPLYPLTIRHVFYRMVSAGLVAKIEGEYKGTVCRLLTVMRKRGELPYPGFPI